VCITKFLAEGLNDSRIDLFVKTVRKEHMAFLFEKFLLKKTGEEEGLKIVLEQT
jgi:hypothetical protein